MKPKKQLDKKTLKSLAFNKFFVSKEFSPHYNYRQLLYKKVEDLKHIKNKKRSTTGN